MQANEIERATQRLKDEMVQRILEEIKRSVHSIHDKALAEYRRAYESRHKILNGFMPFWRSLDKTLAQADRVIVLDHGRIVERGTHRALLAREGEYARMWALQQEAARAEAALAQARTLPG